MSRVSAYQPGRVNENARTGGSMPSLRTTYPASVARALHALAESKPDAATYAAEKARILEATR